MATPSRRTRPAVSQQLADEPHRFAFFQAVRVLEAWAREVARGPAATASHAVGHDGPPHQEAVRFRTLPAHTFPPSEIHSLLLRPTAVPGRTDDGERASSGSDGPERPSYETDQPLAEMTVALLGLIGPVGVLPRHYTQLVIDRVRQKDFALRDFLDLFQHRLISLFYRAWEKYRLPAVFERAAQDPQADAEDLFTRCLYCLVGYGTAGLRGRLAYPDPLLLHYSGHFAHAPRNAVSLEAVLEDYFELPARVLPFQGQWLYLDREDQSCTPSVRAPAGQHCRLGRDVVVGRRVWSVENKFRVRLGPLTYAQFCRFLPRGDGLRPLAQLVRSYAGPEFDFDVQPVLQAHEVPWCRAGDAGPVRSRLGWNTWLRSQPMPHDAADAVFVHDGFPEREPERPRP